MALLTACNPTLNWREVRPEGTRLALLLPCKPDKAQKTVPLGGPATPISMLGCDAGGATFAVAVVQLGDARHAGPALALWQSGTLASMKANLPSCNRSRSSCPAPTPCRPLCWSRPRASGPTARR